MTRYALETGGEGACGVPVAASLSGCALYLKALTVLHLWSTLGIVRTPQLHDPLLPMPFLSYQLVDLVIEVPYPDLNSSAISPVLAHE